MQACACSECGHLHWHGARYGYSPCPISGCTCPMHHDQPAGPPTLAEQTDVQAYLHDPRESAEVYVGLGEIDGGC